MAGIALIGLGIACLLGARCSACFVYSTGVMVYLAYLGIVGPAGVLLWPARVILHVVLSVFLALDIRNSRRDAAS